MSRELITRNRRAMLGVMAGTCLALSACGASSGLTPGEATPPSSPIPASTKQLCDKISGAMNSMAGQNPSGKMTLTQARHVLDGLLNNGISNFGALEREPAAPASLTKAFAQIVSDLQKYKEQTAKATSVKQLLDSTVKANPVDKQAYQMVLGYTATSCS